MKFLLVAHLEGKQYWVVKMRLLLMMLYGVARGAYGS